MRKEKEDLEDVPELLPRRLPDALLQAVRTVQLKHLRKYSRGQGKQDHAGGAQGASGLEELQCQQYLSQSWGVDDRQSRLANCQHARVQDPGPEPQSLSASNRTGHIVVFWAGVYF